MVLTRAVTDRIFGFDVFISYSRHDGMAYAQQLEEDLRRIGFRCFLDFKEMPAGEVLTASLRNSLKRSSSLVLVVSVGALLHSHYMPREFDYYIGARRSPKIVPISIGRALDESGPDVPLNQRVRDRADVIWISEREEQLTRGPSAKVLKALIDSFRFTRRNAIRNRVVSAVGLILAGLLMVAIWMGIRAEKQRRLAVIERDHARATLSHSDFLQALRLSMRIETVMQYLNLSAACPSSRATRQHSAVLPHS